MRQALVILAVVAVSAGAEQARVSQTPEYSPTPALVPTPHPVLPRDLSQLWLVPGTPFTGSRFSGELASAMELRAKGDFAKALPVLSRSASQEGPLGVYAIYDAAVALLNLNQPEEARRLFRSVSDRKPLGYLADAAALGEAQSADAMNDLPAAIAIYDRLQTSKALPPDELLWRLGTDLKAAGQPDRAIVVLSRVYYEFPTSEFAARASADLANLRGPVPAGPDAERYRLEMARAAKLFAAKEYGPARTAFTALKPLSKGDDRELVDLRIAEANYFLKRPRDTRDDLKPYLTTATRRAEALHYHALALRDLGAIPEYTRTIRQVVREFPTEIWAQEGLNNLASYHIVQDQDDLADSTFRELYALNPKGVYAERAAWKIGWRAFLQQRYPDTVTFFERAAVDFPRSDYRPAWIYWSGRAHELNDERALATERFTLVTADYLNSYYGRLALKRLSGRQPAPRVVSDRLAGGANVASPSPEHAALIRSLVEAGFFTHAANELRYAQKVTGDSPAIQATLSWVQHEQGLVETGQTRFTLLRGSITTMRRAYPQFMAAGGELLPREILALIFPLEYWDLIQKYSAENALDPYLVAALVAQESTFTADVRSSANAVGLMQLLPSTARQQARKLGLTYSTRLLTSPEANIRMGTLYFAEKIREFGSEHLALASYNAGESPVRRWVGERPSFGVDEFIDDIPYPETQNYVKRILGTAEDYRKLYGK